MADAPRSILAWLGGPHQGLSFAGGPSGKEIEYIRADVARADAELVVAEVKRLRSERDALRAVLAPAMDACKILDEAVKAGHETTSDLILHLLSAVEPSRQALKGQTNE